ncbi:hypothetical protein MTO96_029668 [Rhipicephalus appendiculatus]
MIFIACAVRELPLFMPGLTSRVSRSRTTKVLPTDTADHTSLSYDSDGELPENVPTDTIDDPIVSEDV